MAKVSVARAAAAVAESLALQMGYIFVDAELVKEHGSAFLRIYVDAPDGMSLDKCESFHRALAKQIDDLDFDYLEVSSPGLDRPLRRSADYDRNIGKPVQIRLFKPEPEGKREFAGVLLRHDAETFTLDTPDGEKTFIKKNCAKAAPMLDLEEELRAADAEGLQKEKETNE